MNLRRISLLIALTSALALSSNAFGSPVPASAASPGKWTDWTGNQIVSCATRTQIPFLDPKLRVVAYAQVYCSQQTTLTVRGRVRSNRTFSDVTVGEWGCTGTTECVRSFSVGITTLGMSCKQTSSRVSHGYHSDILIYPGIQQMSSSGSTSPSVTFSSYCGA